MTSASKVRPALEQQSKLKEVREKFYVEGVEKNHILTRSAIVFPHGLYAKEREDEITGILPVV